MTVSFTKRMPLLHHTITDIVGGCSDEHMIRIDARGIVATMTNDGFRIDFSVAVLKRNAMRTLMFAIQPNQSIAIVALKTKPQPTTILLNRSLRLHPL